MPSMAALRDIIGDYTTFLDDLLARVANAGFDTSDFVQIDHLCYRTTSADNYHEKKAALSAAATLLRETQVNGRPIATFRLCQPIMHAAGWRIDAVELPAPKAGRAYAEGLEHMEFVLYDDIPTFLKKYEGKPFELRAANRGINPEVGLQLGDRSVKFHLLSLPTVVYLEEKLGLDDVRDDLLPDDGI